MTSTELQRGNSEVFSGRAAYTLVLRLVRLNMAPVLLAYHVSRGVDDLAGGYRKFVQEMALVGLANALESSLVDIERETDATFNVWDEPTYELRYHEQARLVRALHHVVIHSESVIGGNSLAGRVLMDQFGAVAGAEVGALTLDVPTLFSQCYVFLLDLVGHIAGVAHPLLELPEAEQAAQVTALFIPEGL